MSDKASEFLEELDAIVALLDTHDVRSWAQHIHQQASELRAGDLDAYRRFLGNFGGMGSLNDLVICRENGDRITEEETQQVNQQLMQRLGKAAGLARQLSSKPESP